MTSTIATASRIALRTRSTCMKNEAASPALTAVIAKAANVLQRPRGTSDRTHLPGRNS